MTLEFYREGTMFTVEIQGIDVFEVYKERSKKGYIQLLEDLAHDFKVDGLEQVASVVSDELKRVA